MSTPPASDLPPQYKNNWIDEHIQTLQQNPPSEAAARAAADKIINSLKQTQLTALSKEITATMRSTLALQADLGQVFQTLKTLEQQSPNSSDTAASEGLQSCYKMYDELLWKGRQSATSSASAQCLGGFITVIVNGLIVDPDVPDDAVIEELENFIKTLPSSPVAKPGDPSFDGLSQSLSNVQDVIKNKLKNSHDSDAEKAQVSALEKELTSAKLDYDRLLPVYLRAVGIDSNAPFIAVVIGLAPEVLFDTLRGHPLENFGKVVSAHQRVKDIEGKLSDARRSLLQANSANQSSDVKWREVLAKIDQAHEELVNHIQTSLSVLDRIRDAVASDCNAYLKFLRGPDSKNKEMKDEEIAKLKSSAVLFEELRLRLDEFSTAVVPPPTS